MKAERTAILSKFWPCHFVLGGSNTCSSKRESTVHGSIHIRLGHDLVDSDYPSLSGICFPESLQLKSFVLYLRMIKEVSS